MACSECNVIAAAADRAELWDNALKRLKDAKANDAFGSEVQIEPGDVLTMALYLSGEISSA